jgi:hypothetical protein
VLCVTYSDSDNDRGVKSPADALVAGQAFHFTRPPLADAHFDSAVVDLPSDLPLSAVRVADLLGTPHSISALKGQRTDFVADPLGTRHTTSMGVQAGTEAAAEGPTVDSWCVLYLSCIFSTTARYVFHPHGSQHRVCGSKAAGSNTLSRLSLIADMDLVCFAGLTKTSGLLSASQQQVSCTTWC